MPGDPANGTATTNKRTSEVGAAAGEKKKKKAGDNSKAFDMDKLAEKLQKLNEDDLLQVVQMVHDHKSEESWFRNDAERKHISQHRIVRRLTLHTEGEFHVDLFTLPDNLIKMLWDFTNEKAPASATA